MVRLEKYDFEDWRCQRALRCHDLLADNHDDVQRGVVPMRARAYQYMNVHVEAILVTHGRTERMPA